MGHSSGSAGSGQSTTDLVASLGMSADVIDTAPRPTGGVGASLIAVDGTLYLTYFTPLVSKTVSQFSASSATSGASTSLTLARIGLYTAAANGDVTLVARSASNTSLFSSLSTIYTEAFSTTGGYPASYALVAGTRYAVGVLQVGSGVGRLIGTNTVTGAIGNLSPIFSARKTSQTDIDGNVSSVAASDLLAAPWVRLS